MTEIEYIDIRGSEIATFRQCPLLHKLTWVDLWAKPENSYASDLGTAWHLVMGVHYEFIRQEQFHTEKLRLSRISQQRILDAVDAIIEHRVVDELRETVDWMYDGHIEHYGFDDHWEVLAVEKHQVVLWPGQEGMRTQFRYSWTSDLVVRDHSMARSPALVVDQKSTGQLLRKEDIDLSDQLAMYTWAERLAGTPVLAPLHRQAHTKKLKRAQTLNERFAEINSYRTDIELDNIADEIYGIAVTISDPGRYLYSSPDVRQCSWKCDFREPHLAMRKLRDPQKVLPSMLRARGYVQRAAVPSGHDQMPPA